MARTIAPLLSFDASGQIAHTQVYSSWKGRPYVRRYVIPGNPNSDAQKLTRRTFALLTSINKYAPAGVAAALTAYADVLRITRANALTKASLRRLVTNKGTDMAPIYDDTDLLLSPGARGAPGLPAVTITPDDGELLVEVSGLVLPSGWTGTPVVWTAASPVYTGATWEAVPDVVSVAEGSDPTPAMGAYAITLSDLTNDQDYVVNTWAVYLRPDGLAAFTVADVQVATPAA